MSAKPGEGWADAGRPAKEAQEEQENTKKKGRSKAAINKVAAYSEPQRPDLRPD